MLVRNLFQAARLLNNPARKNALALCLNHQQQQQQMMIRRQIGSRPPPLTPGITEEDLENAHEYDPKRDGSLEEFLNIRFGPFMPTINDDKSEMRDLVNFPRPVHVDFAEPTRLGILPESWFKAFYEKTGVTGPYCFVFSFLTFLLSKEWLVFEHELLVGIEATIIIVAGAKMFGPQIRNSVCSQVDEVEKAWDNWQKGMIQFLNDYIKTEETIRDSPQHHRILFDAKRENVQLQLEAEYRRRQMEAYNEVRKRLEFLVAREEAEKQFQQKQMVDWIIDNVVKSFTPAQERDAFKMALAELKRLSSTVKL